MDGEVPAGDGEEAVVASGGDGGVVAGGGGDLVADASDVHLFFFFFCARPNRVIEFGNNRGYEQGDRSEGSKDQDKRE